MRKVVLIFFVVFLLFDAFAQGDVTQTIRGLIVDKQGQYPLTGAVVQLGAPYQTKGAVTDLNGEFKIDDVPVGRVSLKVSYLGYEEIILSNLLLNAGKELYLNLEMEESVVTKDIIVITGKKKTETNNQSIVASGRTFSVEESNRFAGSWGDPSRMASSFAGVQGANDQRNDIIVRGNSPNGILWRLEGIDIPNPNHFGSQGSTGGPISILNNNLLSNSDFITGAFPAMYGNALAGVFDLTMRTGNNQKRENLAQVGFNGFEFLAEGPISKKNRSSYLIAYRYSTLDVFQRLGISFGVSGVPQYQDLSFKLNFPSKKLGTITLFGIGGKSQIALLMSERDSSDWSFGQNNSDIYYGTQMGVVGISQKKIINKKTYYHLTVAATGHLQSSDVDSVGIENGVVTSTIQDYDGVSSQGRLTAHALFNKRFSAKANARIGIIGTQNYFNTKDSSYLFQSDLYRIWSDFSGTALLLQPYFQFQYKFSNLLTLNLGVQEMMYLGNDSYSFEPRVGLKYRFHEKQSVSLAYGKHSQLQPFYTYFAIAYDENFNNLGSSNAQLDLSKSNHLVLGYDWNINRNLRFKSEVYYQWLSNIPVESFPSSFSMANYGSDFTSDDRDFLVNEGSGRNMGIEFTFEKFFSNNYYFLLTNSLFDSKYKGSNGIEHNTVFNGNYVVNVLVGKEFHISKKALFEIDVKYVAAGGRRFTPFETKIGPSGYFAIEDESRSFSLQHRDYQRFDFKLAFRVNGKKVTQSLSADVQNLFNRQNVLTQAVDPTTGKLTYEYQLGLFPIGSYKIEF